VDPDRFTEQSRRHVRRAEGGYWAFVPPPLPPDLTLSAELVAALSTADRATGEVSGLGRTLPNPHLLAMSLLRREAVLSSRIEGTQASMADLVLYEADPQVSARTADVREVANYVTAANHVLDTDRRLPMSLPLLLEAHAILMAGVRGSTAAPGEFRRTQNWIGAPGCLLVDASCVPPSPADLWSCLDAFEKYLHVDDTLPPLLRIAAIHYQFEAIHPFLDGNGRIGRLLVVALMVEWGLLPGPLLDISAFIEPRRDEYYGALMRVTTHGDWQGWMLFFLDAVTTQSRAALQRAPRLRALRDEYRRRLATPRASALLPALVDGLFASPAITIGEAAKALNVTHRSATVNIEKLVSAGVLQEVEMVGKRRRFIAGEIIDSLTQGTEPNIASSPTDSGGARG